MAWQQLIVCAFEKNAEQIADYLFEVGSLAVTLRDREDTPQFEETLGQVNIWPQTDVVALFPADEDLTNTVESLKTEFNLKQADIRIEILENKNWNEAWKENFNPIEIRPSLWIIPSWHKIVNLSATNILLDPGMAFGTGSHPTTHLMLEWIADNDLKNKSVIDYGCGSGILGIAAAKQQAASVVMIDNDANALVTCKENTLKNNVTAEFYLPNQYPITSPVDIILANILANPLLELAPELAALTLEKGLCILSGILSEQANTVIDAYAKWFKLKSCDEREGWVRIALQK